jgi:hypothetical protein
MDFPKISLYVHTRLAAEIIIIVIIIIIITTTTTSQHWTMTPWKP